MDFFSQQDRARRNTRYLVVLFILALSLIVLLVNALVTAFLWVGGDYNIYVGGTGWKGYLALFSWDRFAIIGLAVVSTVGFVSLVRWLQLASGGKAVAESLGGRRVLRQSADPYEKRCLNIVEELSLAANMPVPALYVLPEERGINAFAAGVNPTDAVVAVTRGAALQLTRDELQGVVAHEFSHILNGDMRLGIRLASLLKGITFIGDVGHFLLRMGAYGVGRSNRRSESSAALPVVGLGLMIIGWLGSLAAGFIKAAISRQKEYLADASAVQFTRDTSGIADALKVIGGFVPGSLVHSARAPEMSHIFFGEVRHRLWEGFATHPPLDRRIRRLDKNWNGQFIQRSEVRYATEPLSANDVQTGVGRAALVAAAMANVALPDEAAIATDGQTIIEDAEFSQDQRVTEMVAENDLLGETVEQIPEVLHNAVLEPLGATAVALALVTARRQDDTLNAALTVLKEKAARGQEELVARLLPKVSSLGPGQRFPLMASAMPALKSMSTPQYREFKTTLLSVIQSDGQIDLFEWCLFQLLRHYLDPEYLRVENSRPRYRHMAKVRAPLRQVLSVLAHQGTGDSARAFALACEDLKLSGLQLLPLAQCSVAEFSRGVHTLADCYPLLKPRILKAMALAAADDGEVCPVERELVVAVAAVMDCPLPPELALS
ncbi:M48 family metallopeptidase [Congregibacter brevis]|uniref:M48 family metallopeptidase n=1 Tax=Congregibacter brevis TaxID=3081201 RepID=A0ABZ0IDF7_9GAMM|nr:M48 family metallopeptidase [Congregibacter sp. IMCC45268]